MACFIVPAGEAVVTTIVTKALKKREAKAETVKLKSEGEVAVSAHKLPFSRKLNWLNTLLWGGSALLAFEHIWHGEVTPWFPFLTAAGNPQDTVEMLYEMATVGVTMSAMVTFVWLCMLAVSSVIERRALKAPKTEE